jgi:hypothetical protein
MRCSGQVRYFFFSNRAKSGPKALLLKKKKATGLWALSPVALQQYRAYVQQYRAYSSYRALGPKRTSGPKAHFGPEAHFGPLSALWARRPVAVILL